jgi:hypothetical protein
VRAIGTLVADRNATGERLEDMKRTLRRRDFGVKTYLSECDDGAELAGRVMDALHSAELLRAIVGLQVSLLCRERLAAQLVADLQEAALILGCWGQ